MTLVIGLDTGGTYTDAALIDVSERRVLATGKSLTTVDDLSVGVGDYLVPHLLGFAVKQYDPQGNVKRTIKTDLAELGGRAAENWPFTAILLESDNILVNLTHGNKTVEFDQAGKVVWRVDNSHVAGRFDDPCRKLCFRIYGF